MNSGPRANLQQIADAASVSRMTVSMALRNDPRVAAATGVRIRAIAEQLGYRPNPLVSALMTHIRASRPVESTTAVVFLSAFPKGETVRANPTFRRYYVGAERRAEQLGYRMEEWSLREPGMTGERLSHILWSRGIQALLIGPQPMAFRRRHLRMEWSHFACATFNYRLWKPDLHRVANNHFLTMMLLLRRLRRLGYQRVGLALETHVDNGVNNAWLAAYLGFQARMGLSSRGKGGNGAAPDDAPAAGPPVPPLLLDPPALAAAIPGWLDRHAPDAVISMDPNTVQLLRATGRRVPEDLGFASLDLQHLDGRCAGMNQHSEEVGAAAIDLIDGQMHRNERGLPAAPLLIQIGSTWVPGATVRAPRGAGETARSAAVTAVASPESAGVPAVA